MFQKAVAETQHTVLTDNGCRLHETEIKLLRFQSMQPRIRFALQERINAVMIEKLKRYEEAGGIVTLVATATVSLIPPRRTVESEDTLSPPLLVPTAEGELPNSLTDNGKQNNTVIQSKNLEKFERRTSIRLRTADPRNYYGAIRYW